MSLLEVQDLHTSFFTDAGEVKAVNGVSFFLDKGKVLGIVGESGSGKSVTAYSIMQILASTGKIVSGSIKLDGQELVGAGEDVMKHVRGNKVSIIFQDPMTSLNPTYTIGHQLMEAITLHTDRNRKQAWDRAVEMLRLVNVNEPEKRMKQYPYEFSGGMRQRVMIAMALACSPKLIIADEPTTALDVTIQAQILDLLRNLKDQINSSIMFITHDLGVIAEMADYVVVMYAGRIVEQGTAEEIFAHPAHPYTIGLMASKPVVGRQVEKLYSIPGKVPNPINMPNYCYFKDRCEMCVNGCEGDYPCEVSISPTHKVSCYRYYDGKRPDLEEIVEEELAEGKENGKEGE
mgnify:CR=1 FL=1